MKGFAKKAILTLGLVGALIGSTSAVFAASGNYSTTYDMDAGVYSKITWSPTSTPTFGVVKKSAV
ncbi:hypothetical protein [Paenibacillus yonginensis]|uniref:hypothetical protein n=1 Tax=Paenibacillus yonginensis TaxID=1462996 RepID=UPI00124491B5|nr:hypothetical protein [Paenibacillus yonginensis]